MRRAAYSHFHQVLWTGGELSKVNGKTKKEKISPHTLTVEAGLP